MLRSIVPSTMLVTFVFLLHTVPLVWGICEEGSLPCDDGHCVRREVWCDSSENCQDGSDEAYCRKKGWLGISPNNCNKKIHFRCADGLCWPSSAQCDGNLDCQDGSDENGCDAKGKKEDDLEVKKDEWSATNDRSEEIKIQTEEHEYTPKEDSEDENNEWKEISEENASDKATAATVTFPSTEPSNAYGDDKDENEDYSPETTTYTEIPTTKEATPGIDANPVTVHKHSEFSSESPLWPSTTETDFYARKMERNGQKRQHTELTVPPVRVQPPSPLGQYPSRQFNTQYPKGRKPAIPYTGPTRPYAPRSYRITGAQSGQVPSPYRGRYSVQQPLYPSNSYRSPYYSSDNNHFPSQRSTNHEQQYPYPQDNSGRSDRQNGAPRPSRIYGRQLKAPSRFYFRKNYTDIYGRTNYPSVERGAEWILSVRNSSGGWGKETPRALVALSLVNNSFLVDSFEKDLMQKYFQTHLGMNLLRNEPVSLSRLSMFVNALIATCQDPRDFQGWDLTELIRNTIVNLNRASRPPVINPLVYLSLCLADRNLTHYEVHHLMTYLVSTRNDEATRDKTSLALEAFACHMQKERNDGAQYYALQKMVWNATSKILRRMKEDGSFGSVYSTSVAAQALMSVNETVEWDPEPTFRFLKTHQHKDGSFGNFLATYYALPALSGRSLLHLRNTECNPPRVDRDLSPLEILQYPGPKNYIRYSLHFGSPLSTAYTIQVLVPDGISFFDVMRVAAFENEQFKFSYEEAGGKISVYSIADLPNDPEQDLIWRLYVRSPLDVGNTPDLQQLYTGDIREFLPTPEQHVIFWYHPVGVRF